MTDQGKREKAIEEMRSIVDKYCTAIDDACGCESECFPCRGVLGELFENGYRKSKSIWHDFRKEKPEKNGMYTCITALKCGGYMIHDSLFYTESGLFNWNGKGEDTSIPVVYWAEIEDLVAQAREGVL